MGATTKREGGKGSSYSEVAVDLDEKGAGIVEDASENGDIVVIRGRSEI